MIENRNFTKEDALELLDITIKEMQQSLSQREDDDDVYESDLSAEINLMNYLYGKLCLLFECKYYGTDFKGFVYDLQNKATFHDLSIDDDGASFVLKHRRWGICYINNTLEITYSDNVGVDGVELKHGKMLSAEALIVLDNLTIEIFEKFNEVMPLLRAESNKRGQNKEGKLPKAKHVYELTSLVLLNRDFPTRKCKRISYCMYSSLRKAEDAEEHFDPDVYSFPDNYGDCFGHFIEQKDVNYAWSDDMAKSFLPNLTVNACNIYKEDKVLGCKQDDVRFKKGDIVWCVDTRWYDEITLGIVYSIPHTNVWYQNRLSELREVFGDDYSFEMDADSYIICSLGEDHESSSYPKGYCHWCSTPYVFPIKESIPEDIKNKLIELLNYMDAIDV